MAGYSINKRQKVFDKCGGKCAYCGCKLTLKDMTVDHIIPKSKDGGSDISNLFPACRSCNFLKNNLSMSEFIERVGDLLSKGEYKFYYATGKVKKVRFYFMYLETKKPVAKEPAAKEPAIDVTVTKYSVNIPISLYPRLLEEAKKEGVSVEQYVVYKLSA